MKLDRVKQWEEKHRPAGAGDVVLFRSGYSDRFYRPLPEGRRFVADPLERKAIAWPDPDPETMDYLASHGVMHIGTDSPTMGAMPNLGEPIHFAALKYGAVLTEGATNLESLPKTGGFYCLLSPKHADGPYGEARSFAIVGGDLPAWLIDAARKRRVADLSVTMSIDLPLTWPGVGAGRHRHRYTKTDFLWSDNLHLYHHGHIFDAHAGTHLVPPSYALPPEPLPAAAAAPETRAWLEEFEKEFGPRGTSRVTTEQVPIAQTCGWMRVVDVRHLVGTVGRDRWPASPLVTVEELERFEAQHGPIKPGEIVVLRTGHTDRFFLPRAAGAACLSDPVNGKSEGWPASTPRRSPGSPRRRSAAWRPTPPPSAASIRGRPCGPTGCSAAAPWWPSSSSRTSGPCPRRPTCFSRRSRSAAATAGPAGRSPSTENRGKSGTVCG